MTMTHILALNSFWTDIRHVLRFDDGAVIASIVLILMVITARILFVRLIIGNEDSLSETRRRWISIVQNTSILFGVVGLLFIWSPQLSTFALSLTAFIVAIVIATKEYLLCVVGGVYRATSTPFKVGDWIEVSGMRGEVIIEGILTTRLQELGKDGHKFEFTGRVLTLPNSVFLTQTVFNENARKYYLHHVFTVTLEPGVNPEDIIDAIKPLPKPASVTGPKSGGRYMAMVEKSSRIDAPPKDGRISVETTDLGKIAFTITIFCAVEDAMAIEEKITLAVLKKANELISLTA